MVSLGLAPPDISGGGDGTLQASYPEGGAHRPAPGPGPLFRPRGHRRLRRVRRPQPGPPAGRGLAGLGQSLGGGFVGLPQVGGEGVEEAQVPLGGPQGLGVREVLNGIPVLPPPGTPSMRAARRSRSWPATSRVGLHPGLVEGVDPQQVARDAAGELKEVDQLAQALLIPGIPE